MCLTQVLEHKLGVLPDTTCFVKGILWLLDMLEDTSAGGRSLQGTQPTIQWWVEVRYTDEYSRQWVDLKIIEMDLATLQDVSEKCRSPEFSKSIYTALRDEVSARAVSQNKQDKKALQKKRYLIRSCYYCGRQHDQESCPDIKSTYHASDKNAGAPKCPAKRAECTMCNLQGHY